MHYQRSLQQHIFLFCIIVVTCLIAIFLFNVLVDPYQIYGNPMHVKKRPGDLKNKSHLIKAMQIMRDKPTTLLLGSSTVDCGFALPGSTSNFDYPDFSESLKTMNQALHHKYVFNGGINGATLRDIYQLFLHAYKNNPHLNHVILGLEWHLFTDEMPPTRFGPDVPALHQTHIPITTLINTTLTLQSLYDSIRTLPPNSKLLRNLIRIYDKLSHFIQPVRGFFINHATEHSQFDLVEENIPIYFKPQAQQVVIGQKGSETTALLLSIYYLSTLFHYYEKKDETALLNPEAFEYLQKIVNFARTKNIKLDVYITPQHGTHWVTAERFGLGNYVDTWLSKIAAITSFWDFSGRIDFHDDVSDYFGGDDRHFKYKAGEIILPTILAGKFDRNSGINFVNHTNIELFIKKRHFFQAQWLQHNPYLAGIFNAPNFQKLRHRKTDMQKLLIQFQPRYHEYYIFRFLGNILALPANEAPYDIGRLIRQEYTSMLQARSSTELMVQMNAKLAS